MAVHYPIVRLVSEPAATAEVRFDFNEGKIRPTADSFTIGTPSLQGDSGAVNASYGSAIHSFDVRIAAPQHEALRTKAQLGRELMRPVNYLLFQLSEYAPPVWWKIVRSSPAGLSLASVYRRDEGGEQRWNLAVSLVTDPYDPFGMGERITHEIIVQNDPTEADGLAVELPEIKGDAPAPLVIDMPVAGSDDSWPLFSVAALDADWPGLEVWQAESWTMNTDATVTADATASNGSRVTVSFATAEYMTIRLTGEVSPTLAGRYLLFARMDPVAAGANTVSVKGWGHAVTRPTESTFDAGGGWRMVELGEFSFPAGNQPTSRPYTISPSGFDVEIQASRSGGSVTLNVDYIVAIPLDGIDHMQPARSLMSAYSPNMSAGGVRRYNGEREVFEAIYTVGGHLGVEDPAQLRGSFPEVVPGATNVLHFLPNALNTYVATDDIAASHTLTLSYRPRHVWLPS